MFDRTDRPLTEPHAIRVIGAPFDGTVSFRPGARFGPGAIREASNGLETWSPVLERDLAQVAYADAGDLELPMGDVAGALSVIRAAVEEALDAGAAPFVLGGEHLVSLPAIEAVAARRPELVVVQLDAHADLRDDYLGVRLSHACVMRRVADIVGFGRMRQIGIRSGTREEYALMRDCGTLTTFRPDDLEALADWIGSRPLYLTVDLDVFDPAALPGTGTPEPGGIDWWTFQRFVQAIRGREIAGLDVVELAPQLDASGCSSVLAAKCVRELLLMAGEATD